MTETARPLLHDWFRRGLAANPSGPALWTADGALTYTDLDRRARSWAVALGAGTGRPPRRVGILASKSPEAYLGLLGTLYAGATAVPLGPEAPVARNVHIAAAAGIDALVADPAGAAQVPGIAAAVPLGTVLAPRTGPHGGGGPFRGEPPGELADEYREPETRDDGAHAYILFTSGSTGRPKGVPTSHANISAFVRAGLRHFDFGPDDRFSQFFEMTFDPVMIDLFLAWASGACVFPISRLQAFSPARLVEKYGLTVWHSTPGVPRALAAQGRLAEGSMPGLRYSIFCGEPLLSATAAAWRRAAPASAIDNMYGPTELTVVCTAHRVPAGTPVDTARDTVPIGLPLPGMEYLLRDDGGGTGPDTGELCMSGPQMIAGYLDPANDAGRFFEHAGRRWYRTGDRVRSEPGTGLVHLGRTDSQVKINGYRIELSEVTAALRAVSGTEAAAFVVGGGEGPVLTAVVLEGAEPDLERLTLGLAERLPPYMLPRHLWWLPKAPQNGNGKIDLTALRAEAERRLARQPAG